MWTYIGDDFDEDELLEKMKVCGYAFSRANVSGSDIIKLIKSWGSDSLSFCSNYGLTHSTAKYLQKTQGDPVPQEVFFSKYYESQNKLVCEFDFEEKCLKVKSSNGTEICIYDGVDGISVSFDKALYKANLSSKYDTPVFNVEKL